MSFISYSQNFEDVMLWRALKDVQEGFYIDVGAHDPAHGSVTKAFYERGWSGINIEPIESPFESLKAARARDINLQICAGARNGEIDIYDVLPSGLATTQPSIAEEYRTAGHSVTCKQVLVQTLQEICKEYVTGEIHFLKIDVEGFEKEVLQGADFSIWRPWIVVIEATYPNSPKENFISWEYLILDAEYKFAYFDGLNRFYVAIEHEKMLSVFNTPPNYFDGFALSSSCFFSRQVTAELHQVEADAQKANERALQAEADAQKANERAQRAVADVQKANERALQAEADVQKANERALQAEADAQKVNEGAQRAVAEAHDWWIKADSRERYIQQLHASMSWRITWPIRQVKRLVKFVVFKTINAFKAVMKPVVNLSIQTIMKYPSLQNRVNSYLTRFPSLHSRLRVYAVNHRLFTEVTKTKEANTDLSLMSQRAEEIYLQFKQPPEQVDGDK